MLKVFRSTVRPQDRTTAGPGTFTVGSGAGTARAWQVAVASTNKTAAHKDIRWPTAGAEGGPLKITEFSCCRISGT